MKNEIGWLGWDESQIITGAERRKAVVTKVSSGGVTLWNESLLPIHKRKGYILQAVLRFEYYFNMKYGRKEGREPGWFMFTIKKGRKYGKLQRRFLKEEGTLPLEERDYFGIDDILRPNGKGYTYAYVDMSSYVSPRYGGLMKSNGKQIEPKKHIRAHLFAKDPIKGCTDYGPAYYQTSNNIDHEWYAKENGLDNGSEEE